MNRRTRLSLIIGLVGLVAASQGACAASTPAPAPASSVAAAPESSAASASPSAVGGMTSCTKADLATAATGVAEALGKDNVYSIDELHCADGWAVTSGVLAHKDDPSMGAPTSFVFEQEGQFWVAQDKTKVCGTNPTTTAAPADATIPAALFLPGCAAG